MLWVVVFASIIGFLAVIPLASSEFLRPFFYPTLGADVLNPPFLTLTLIGLLISGVIVGLLWYDKSRKPVIRPLGARSLWRWMAYGVVFVGIVLASSSLGLQRELRYRQSLLTQPLTLDATIVSQQLSDTVNIALDLPIRNNLQTNHSQVSQSLNYGTLYPRQVWQIIDTALQADGEAVPIKLPLTVMVTANLSQHPEWQSVLNQLPPHQPLNVKLALTPILSPTDDNLPANANIKPLRLGFDQAAWLRQRGIQATGEVIDINERSVQHQNGLSSSKSLDKQPTLSATRIKIETWRWQFRQKMLSHFRQAIHDNTLSDTQILAQGDSHAILLGLLTGDTALMDSRLKNRYQITGISHLLAISGPHVTMLASVVAMLLLWFIKLIYPQLLMRLPSQLIVLWVSVIVAGVYALFVGFELPAQRTFWMLLMLTVATQWLVTMTTYRLLAMVGMVMVWLDPIAITQAGFWLSFVAVGLLVKFSQQTTQPNPITWQNLNDNHNDNHKGRFILEQIVVQLAALFKLQLWLFVWLMPIVVWFFGKVSLIGLLVNLVAVPFLGLVIVPLDMLAGLLSLIPILGETLANGLWSLLSSALMFFHAFVEWLINKGLAKQAFFSLTHSQLLLITLAILLYFARGVLPRLLIVPMCFAGIAVTLANEQASDTVPLLAVMDDSNLSISLVKKGKEAWLILADNRNLIPTTANSKSRFQKSAQPLAMINSHNRFLDTTLSAEIYPLLASLQVSQLSGVINQTPSAQSNDLVQQLAKDTLIKQYWLAGFDPLHSHTATDTGWRFDQLTPTACAFGKTWQSADNTASRLTLNAVSGWQLDLPEAQLNTADKLAAQTCDIQITVTNPALSKQTSPYQALLTAGRSQLPLAMSMKLCQASHTQLLISPYQTPLDKTWLEQSKPKILHVLTGAYANETLADNSQFVLAELQNPPPPTAIFAHQVGSVVYQLAEPSEKRQE